MNKLTFRVAIKQARGQSYHSIVPGMLICATGNSVTETLENTKLMITDYLPDSIAALDAFDAEGLQDFKGASWHIIEILR